MDKIMNEKHTPISGIRDDIPVEVDMVLDKALAKNPDALVSRTAPCWPGADAGADDPPGRLRRAAACVDG